MAQCSKIDSFHCSLNWEFSLWNWKSILFVIENTTQYRSSKLANKYCDPETFPKLFQVWKKQQQQTTTKMFQLWRKKTTADNNKKLKKKILKTTLEFFQFCDKKNQRKKSIEKFPRMQNKAVTWLQGTKIFQYCTWTAGRVTYNIHSSCKHMHLSFKNICNKVHKGVIWLPLVILPKAFVL